MFLGSYAGCFSRPYSPVYAATKWWLRGFAKSLAGQFAEDDAAITAMNMSDIHIDFGGGVLKEWYEKAIASSKDISSAIVFAASQMKPSRWQNRPLLVGHIQRLLKSPAIAT